MGVVLEEAVDVVDVADYERSCRDRVLVLVVGGEDGERALQQLVYRANPISGAKVEAGKIAVGGSGARELDEHRMQEHAAPLGLMRLEQLLLQVLHHHFPWPLPSFEEAFDEHGGLVVLVRVAAEHTHESVLIRHRHQPARP